MRKNKKSKISDWDFLPPRRKGAKFGKSFFFKPFATYAFAGDIPDSLVAANASGRAKKAHAFARVEDVALRPSQDFGLAVVHGTSQANPIQELVLTGVSD